MAEQGGGVTQVGKERLAALVYRNRISSEMREIIGDWLEKTSPLEPVSEQISQNQFARWVSEHSQIYISESAISRLERADGRNGPPPDVLIALFLRLSVLKLPNGEICEYMTAVRILTEDFDPETGRWRAGVKNENGSSSNAAW